MTMEVSFAGLTTDEFSLNFVNIFRSIFLSQHLLLAGPIILAKQQAGLINGHCHFIGKQSTELFKVIKSTNSTSRAQSPLVKNPPSSSG